MKILSGIDLLEIERLKKALEKQEEGFSKRIFTQEELALAGGRIESLAGFFAVKEAVGKALGTGLMAHGISFKDIEVGKDELGAPTVSLAGGAKRRFEEIKGRSISISITHERSYAAAICQIISAEEEL